MQGIFVQLSRLGFLIILWWLIFRVINTIRNDNNAEKVTKTKSRLSNMSLWKTTKPPMNRSIKTASATLKPTTGVARFLVVTHGNQHGTKIILHEDPILIGNSPSSTLIINDDYSSPHHARLTKSGTQWYVEDLGSTNGTFINHARISSTTTVPLNTPIRVGKTVFELQS